VATADERKEAMKRKVYEIKLDGKIVGKKHAWNAAREFVRSHIRENMTGSVANIEYIEYHKDEHGIDHVSGKERWGDNVGNVYNYSIERIV
jgi:hypothetical protein